MKIRLMFSGKPCWSEIKIVEKDFNEAELETYSIMWGLDIRTKCGVSEDDFISNPFYYVSYTIID